MGCPRGLSEQTQTPTYMQDVFDDVFDGWLQTVGQFRLSHKPRGLAYIEQVYFYMFMKETGQEY